MVEDGGDGQVGVEGGADPGGELGGQQGVAAEVEEVVGGVDVVEAEDAGEDVRQQVFDLVARRGVGFVGGVAVGGGQRGVVEFAVGGQRQGVQPGVVGRDHVVGQGGAQVGAQGRGVGPVGAGRDEVGGQLGAGGAGVGGDRGPGDGGVAGEGGFDFGGLDPVAAEFELVVGAAEELQGVIVAPAGQVAGAVQPGTRAGARAGAGARARARSGARSGAGAGAGAGEGIGERVGDEPFRGQIGPGMVAAGQPRPADEDLPGHTHRNRPQPPVQNEHTTPRQHPANRSRRAGILGPHGDAVSCHADRGLRGPVMIMDLSTGECRQPERESPGRGLAAEDQCPAWK